MPQTLNMVNGFYVLDKKKRNSLFANLLQTLVISSSTTSKRWSSLGWSELVHWSRRTLGSAVGRSNSWYVKSLYLIAFNIFLLSLVPFNVQSHLMPLHAILAYHIFQMDFSSSFVRSSYLIPLIDLFHKWRPIYYSFQYMLISPTNLISE